MSAALVAATLALLERDVHATVERNVPGLLVPGAVTGARPRGRRPMRRDKPSAATIEVVLAGRREEREGISSDRVHLDFDLRVFLRAKDASEGRAQVALVQEVAHVLVRRYRGAAELVIAGAAVRYADARLVEADEDPDSTEVARAVVRLTLTFSEPLAGAAP